MYTLRNATQSDAGAIRRLIWQVGINPMDLDWRRFLVAVDEQGRVIGSGQIKPHRDGSRELASIATHPAWRGQGVASAIIRRLLAENPPPLYLETAAHNRGFYPRFGFRILELAEMPAELARNARIMAWIKRHLFPDVEELLVMGLLK
jgi:N-acetylglutamate synthase-like GNAT family acetyltransferase